MAFLTFSASIGFSLGSKMLFRLLLPILGGGALITTIVFPVVSAASFIYYGAELIKNRKKVRSQRLLNDRLFF